MDKMPKEYARRALLYEEFAENYRPPGEEEVPEPRAYEAVIFRDFFVARLQFPCEGFVGDVLTLFNIEIRQLTPNAFTRLSIFVMSSKMMGCTPSANCFAQFYEMQLAKKKVTHPETREKKYAQYGSHKFEPKKTCGTATVVPTFWNKWPRWSDF
jgi:hypothetical protein